MALKLKTLCNIEKKKEFQRDKIQVLHTAPRWEKNALSPECIQFRPRNSKTKHKTKKHIIVHNTLEILKMMLQYMYFFKCIHISKR